MEQKISVCFMVLPPAFDPALLDSPFHVTARFPALPVPF